MLITPNNAPLADVMSHCPLKRCRVRVCQCAWVQFAVFAKNRWEVEYPSNALLTLLSSFLCSPSHSALPPRPLCFLDRTPRQRL